MIKAVFFDIDGTLISFETREIPESALRALKALRARGIKTFVATGRHIKKLGDIQKMYDFDGFVTLNGQYCFDHNGEELHKLIISPEDIKAAVEEAKKNEYPCYFVHSGGQFINMIDEDVLNICRRLKLAVPPIENPEIALDLEVYQLSVYLKKEDEHRIMDRMKNSELARWNEDFIDIIPRNGGKHEGMRRILEHHGFILEEAMAFGDGGNDVSMLVAAGIGVAMGNASENVKLSADYVTDTVDDDGVEKALKHFGLI